MKKNILYIFILFSTVSFAQESLAELLKTFNSETIPYISVQELAMPKTQAIRLDAREIKEYRVSHLEDAIHVGYTDFDSKSLETKIGDKSALIVVYCSIGIRSETIAEKLKKAGYTNIYNLYGGIFEWKNNNFTIIDSENNPTDNVHTYSKNWSKWLLKGNKIYD